MEFSIFFFDCKVGFVVEISKIISSPKIFKLIILKSFLSSFSKILRIFAFDISTK